jgi:hypothetical protein
MEMGCTAHTYGSARELDFRANDGVEVALLWCESEERLFVEVVDHRVGDSFRIELAPTEAFDAFHHPYAYAAWRRVGYAEPLHLEARPISA